MTKTELRNILKVQKKMEPSPSLLEDRFQTVRLLYGLVKEEGRKENRLLRDAAQRYFERMTDGEHMGEVYETIHRTYMLEAPDDLDSYLIALEWKRPPQKRFYLPRRKVLLSLVGDLQDLADRKIDFLGVSLPPRVGKLVSDDTPVLTRKGWKNHGDLAVGDEVISPHGEFVKVTHVFPKAEANVRVHFTDGTSVDVHENHEWVVYNRHANKSMIMETGEMMRQSYETPGEGRGHRYHFQLPIKNFVEGEYKHLPVMPYTLGAWLGDGRNGDPDVCCNPKDRAVIERIITDGYVVSWNTVHKETGVEYYGFKGLREGLQKFDMCHSRRRTPKHIPEEYLTASISQRMDLLAGLLDTDGCLRVRENRYDFSTVEPSLRDSVIQLISTFGWRCSVSCHPACVSSSGIQGKQETWVVSFNPTCTIPCVLERKRLTEFSKPRRVAFCKFEKIDPKPGNCVSVEGGVYCVGKRLTPTHNSTLCIMFMTWIMGKYPESASVMSGHSDKLTDGFYGEVLSILSDAEQYDWYNIFPGIKMADKSAKNETVDLGKKKRFPTLTCRSVGGTLTGAVEIGENGVLYCDDLIEDLEESLNPDRLQAKYDAYLNQLKDRKKLGAMELMVGTRWNVFDPLGRIAVQYENNPRYRFTVIPAVDEYGRSNFNYDYGVGFDDAYYADMKASIDDATWCAKYMGNPYIREGLVFPKDSLRWYNGVLPGTAPDRKVMVADIAWGGGDYTAAPVAYIYGNDVYIPDVVFSNGDRNVTQPAVCACIKRNGIDSFRGEANNGGAEYCETLESMLTADGVHLNIRSVRASSKTSKLGRIMQYQTDIKHFYFLDDRHAGPEYNAFMNQVCMFTQDGKVKHDDAPDALAQLAEELAVPWYAKLEAVRRIF